MLVVCSCLLRYFFVFLYFLASYHMVNDRMRQKHWWTESGVTWDKGLNLVIVRPFCPSLKLRTCFFWMWIWFIVFVLLWASCFWCVCQRARHHFTFTLSDVHHCQEVHMCTSDGFFTEILNVPILSDLAIISVYLFYTICVLMCGLECNLDMNRLQSSQTWLLDVRDQNNRVIVFRNLPKWKFVLIIHDIKQGWGPKRAHLQLNVGGSGDSGLFSMCLCCRDGGGMEEERVPVSHSWCATVSTFYLLPSQLTGWATTRD